MVTVGSYLSRLHPGCTCVPFLHTPSFRLFIYNVPVSLQETEIRARKLAFYPFKKNPSYHLVVDLHDKKISAALRTSCAK